MNLKTIAAAALGCLCGLSAIASDSTPGFAVDTEICDLALLPAGNLPKRAKWDKADLLPYVTHEYADGRREWFYDAFSFNDGTWVDEASDERRVLCNATGGQLPCTKANWEAYLDLVFAKDHHLGALDQLIGELKTTLGEPPMRHKVVLGQCYPAKDGRGTPGACSWKHIDFGTIDGVDIDLSKREHRIKAATWFVDELIRRFNEAGYKNIDLAGIYCPEEGLFSISDFVTDVNDYIHSRGLRVYWIPYWTDNDKYVHHWQDFHFDMVYRQPNYFFYTPQGTLPEFGRLEECIENSRGCGVGLELEFETSEKSNGMHEVSPMMHQRLLDYINEFERLGVWDKSGVAHYCGSKGFIQMAESDDPVNKQTIDRLASIVAKRQAEFKKNSNL